MAGERTLPGLGLTGYWDLGDDTWKDAMDINLRTLSVLVNRGVISRTTSLPGSPSDGDIYIVPTGDAEANRVAIRDDGAWAYLTAQDGWQLFVQDADENVQFDGSVWAVVASGGGSSGATSYDIRFGFSNTPTASETIDTIPLVRGVDWLADFDGSVGVVDMNPAASFTMSVQINATEIGTIEVSTGGVFTFATSGGTVQAGAAAEVLTIVAPAVADASVEGLVVSLKGES